MGGTRAWNLGRLRKAHTARLEGWADAIERL
jgi:hypothetical protein